MHIFFLKRSNIHLRICLISHVSLFQCVSSAGPQGEKGPRGKRGKRVIEFVCI